MNISNFKTKISLINYIKHNMNNSFKIDEKIKDGKFFNLLESLIESHYNYEYLKGSGVEYFFISSCDINPKNRKFNIQRVDGSVVDFSFRKAIDNKEPKTEIYIKAALRLTVQPFVDGFKKNYFEENQDNKGFVICPETALKIDRKNCHTDHEYPNTFDSLFYKYISDNNMDINSIKFKKSGKDNRPVILDNELNKSFYDWHSKNAKLRCIYWRANVQGKRTKNFNTT